MRRNAGAAGAALLIGLALQLAGCKPQQLPVQRVFEAQQCGALTAGVTPITDHAAFAALRESVSVNQFPPRTEPWPEFDPDRETLVLVALGFKPNPGHGLVLVPEPALLVDGVLQLPVRTTAPESGRMYAQMIVNPCLILRLPKLEGVQEIRLLDPDQRAQ
jgi:hypothetical protein